MGEGEVQEWVTFSSAPGRTSVRVTIKQGNLSARVTVKTYGMNGAIKAGVVEARDKANEALEAMREAVR